MSKAANTKQTERFELVLEGVKFESSKSGSYRRVIVDGTAIAVAYPRRKHDSVYFASTLVGKAKGTVDASGNGKFDRRLDVTDAKSAKRANELVELARKALAK